MVLRNKQRISISEFLGRHIRDGIDFYRGGKGSHYSCPKAVDQPLNHQYAEVHHRLLRSCRNIADYNFFQPPPDIVLFFYAGSQQRYFCQRI